MTLEAGRVPCSKHAASVYDLAHTVKPHSLQLWSSVLSASECNWYPCATKIGPALEAQGKRLVVADFGCVRNEGVQLPTSLLSLHPLWRSLLPHAVRTTASSD